MVKAVRGATTVDLDNKDHIIESVLEMVDKIYELNNLSKYSIVSILFSITDDLLSINPAAALRSRGGYSGVPLFCAQEPKTNGALEKAIRVIITWNGDESEVQPVYLNGATILRPDLT